MGVGAGIFSYHETKSPLRLQQVYLRVWEYLSLFQDQWVFLCSASTALRNTHNFQKYRLQTGPYCSTRGSWIGQFLCQLPGAPTSHEGPTHIMELPQLCLFSVWVKVLSLSVLECVVSSLASLKPRLNRQKGLGFFLWWLVLWWSLLFSLWFQFSPVIGYWYKVHYSTYGEVQPSWTFVFLIWMPNTFWAFWITPAYHLCALWQNPIHIFIFIGEKWWKKNEAPLLLCEPFFIVFYYFGW